MRLGTGVPLPEGLMRTVASFMLTEPIGLFQLQYPGTQVQQAGCPWSAFSLQAYFVGYECCLEKFKFIVNICDLGKISHNSGFWASLNFIVSDNFVLKFPAGEQHQVGPTANFRSLRASEFGSCGLSNTV